MARKSEPIEEDIYVNRDVIMRYFNPPPSRSTFFEWVNAGKIVRGPMRGYYALNKSLARIGLPQVDVSQYRKRLDRTDDAEREKQLDYAALAITVPEAIEAGLPLQLPPALTFEESEQVLKKHKTLYALLDDLELSTSAQRVAYVAGAIT